MSTFKIWFEKYEYEETKKNLLNGLFHSVKISDEDFDRKQIKLFDEKDIERIRKYLQDNIMFDKVLNRNDILDCLNFKTDENGRFVTDKNGRKQLINGNCTLSYITRSIAEG